MLPRIDAHHHFWQLGKYHYPWITDETPALQHDFGPAQLRPLLGRHAIGSTVLVQTIASLDETGWFLELSQQNPWIAGVVGWVDLRDAGVGRVLDGLLKQYGRRLVGARHNLHDEPDDRWILQEEVQRGLKEVAHHGLAYDLLIRPRHLPVVLHVVQKTPQLRFVVDHAAKPPIAERGWEDWADGIQALARHEHVYCKLSGLITEADHRRWQPSDLRPYIDHVLSAFGPERIMFGSDWPVCLLAGTYDDVVAALEENLAQLSDNERGWIFGRTAEHVYQLTSNLV